MWIKNSTLQGEHVTLEPLQNKHLIELQSAAAQLDRPKQWYTTLPSAATMEGYVDKAMQDAKSGNIAYVVRSNVTQEALGSTRFYGVDEANRRAMIGYTWYVPSARRTAVNTECKFLLLSNLFEKLDAIAVEFRTHYFNVTSRRAIERLGAKLDGILRSHQITEDGSIRDTVCYSIIATEWPAVKMNLLSLLGRI